MVSDIAQGKRTLGVGTFQDRLVSFFYILFGLFPVDIYLYDLSDMEELNLLLAESVMIRRLKSEVLKQLPPKIRKLVILDPNLVKLESKTLKQSATAFLVAKESKISEAEKRSKMLEYYSITAHAKLPAITAYLRDLIDSGRKFIVFAHHKVMLDGICDDLDTLNCKYIRIDGQTSSEDRQHSVDAFQSREDVRVAVLSIMAANSGITLTAAGLVCFAEMSWNPGVSLEGVLTVTCIRSNVTFLSDLDPS